MADAKYKSSVLASPAAAKMEPEEEALCGNGAPPQEDAANDALLRGEKKPAEEALKPKPAPPREDAASEAPLRGEEPTQAALKPEEEEAALKPKPEEEEAALKPKPEEKEEALKPHEEEEEKALKPEEEQAALKPKPEEKEEEALKPMPEEEEATLKPDDDEEEAPELNLDVVVVVAARLPSKAAYRCSVISKLVQSRLREPSFLGRHLRARPAFVNDIADGFFLQPANREGEGYTHLSLFRRHKVYQTLRLHNEDGAYDFNDPDAVSVAVPVPNFFENTVRDLDIRFVASHGRLLLGRSPSSLYVCDPEEDRWVKVPLPNTLPRDTAEGLEYDIDAVTSQMRFTVVVLVRLSDSRLAVKSFSSEKARWETMEVEHEAASSLGGDGVGPGIYAGGAFFWKNRTRGTVICYDILDARVSVIVEPPVAEGCVRRAGSSLGITGGQLRMCTFDINAQERYGFEVIALDDGVLSIWTRKSAAWVQTEKVLVGELRWFCLDFRGFEIPIDFTGASFRWIVVKKDRDIILRRDLVTGETEVASNLYRRESSLLNSVYRSALALDAFPLFA